MALNPMKFEAAAGTVGLLYSAEDDDLIFAPISHGVSLFNEAGMLLQTRYFSVGGGCFKTILTPTGRVHVMDEGSVPLLEWIDAQRASR